MKPTPPAIDSRMYGFSGVPDTSSKSSPLRVETSSNWAGDGLAAAVAQSAVRMASKTRLLRTGGSILLA